MTTLTPTEAQGATTHRDAQQLTPTLARFTDVAAWSAVLDRHVALGAIEDNEVFFSITALPATQDEVEGKPGPGGHRPSAYFASRHVEAAYMANGKLHKVSVYCGVSWMRTAPTTVAEQLYAPVVQATGERVQEAVRAVSVALSKHTPGLHVISGAALHLHAIDDDPWVAGPGTQNEAPVTDTRCGVCDALLHLVRGEWRDERGMDCLTVDNGLDHNRRPKKRLDHYHRPAEALL